MAMAQMWYLEPSVSLRGFYDDNPRLTTRDASETFGVVARVQAQAGRQTEVSDIGLRGYLSYQQYSDDQDLDALDGNFDITSSYRLQRQRLGLGLGFDQSSTQTSEEQTSGIVQVNKQRTLMRVSPSWGYSISERTTFDLGVNYTSVSYEDVEQVPLFDYVSTAASGTLSHQWTERLSLIGRLSYDGYDADTVGSDSTAYGFEAGLNYLISETWSVRALAGLRTADAQTLTQNGVIETQSSGPLFDLELRRDLIVGGFTIGAERSLLPSGTGTLLDTTGLRLSYDRPITPVWTFGASARIYRNRNPGGEVSGNDRDFISIEPSLRRRLSDSLSLDISYRYRQQSRDIEDETADSNAIFVGLSYGWPREPLSRWLDFGG